MITPREKQVIIAYKNDDHVSDNGWDYFGSQAWIDILSDNSNIKGKAFSGIISSLVKKGLMFTDGEAIGLTKLGIKIAKEIE